MKKNFYLIILMLVTFQLSHAQLPPASVCTYPETYSFDEEVTWYFDLTGNTLVTPGQDLYFWSWEPVQLPGGKVLLTYEKDMLWSLTFVPTELYGVSLADLEDAGNTAFWGEINNASNQQMTGTIPYGMKELLRLGHQCSCVGIPSENDNTFFVNFGSSTVASPDANGFYWTNVSEADKKYRLNDTLDDYRYDISTSGSFAANNNSGFTTPDAALLGNLAVKEATESYLYLTSDDGTITISCLDPERLYNLSIFGSRNTADIRETRYTVTGAVTQSGVLQTSGSGIANDVTLDCNDNTFYEIGVYPSATGTISILTEIESGSFGYINMMKVQEIVNPAVIPVTDIAINTSSLSTSGPSTLTVDYVPINTSQAAVTWSVNNESIAIIDDRGNLKPKKEGTVQVKVTSIYNSSVKDSIDVTFSGLTTELYLSGTASESNSDDHTSAMLMHRIYDADSTVTNLFEAFTDLNETGSLKFYTANDGTGKELGGNGAGTILGGAGNEFVTDISGWAHIQVDLMDSTYTIDSVYGINVISNMLPKGPGQETWWGGIDSLMYYKGLGVWSDTIDFSEPTQADNSSRFYFELAETGRTLRHVSGTKNSLIFRDQSGGVSNADIYHFQGEYVLSIDLQSFTFKLEGSCNDIQANKIAVMGSSVAKGYGASVAADDISQYEGYAYHYDKLLQQRNAESVGAEWDMTNISIGGNTTVDLMNRMDIHLYPQCSGYVIYGLSLANEGISSGGQPIFDQFKNNMLALIDTARAHGIEPIVMGNYPNGGYAETQYNFIKQMNLLIHEWDVASTNVLGTLDDGTGKWVSGFSKDGGHPNNSGYEEFYYAMVPSLFDALSESKPQPQKTSETSLSMGSESSEGMVTIVPEGEVHSFTTSFELKTSATGAVSSLISSGKRHYININSSGLVDYVSANGKISAVTKVNDNGWHNISLTHYYAQGNTFLYVDGMYMGKLAEQFIVDSVMLSDINNAPANIDYRNWLFYRSGMNEEEIESVYNGKMLKSSLEIYAPLDGNGVLGSDKFVNLAQSKNELNQWFTDDWVSIKQITNNQNLLRLYPLPAKQFIHVQVAEALINKPLYIYNGMGQVVKTHYVEELQSQLSISELSPGFYFVKIDNSIRHFIKQ